MMVDEHNEEFVQAIAFVEGTNNHVFLTGKAGTGKTNFLKELAKHTHKKMIVVAPTGVAAINAGGMTIHNIFPIPREPIVAANLSLLEDIRFTTIDREVLTSIELIVIDEASMVRADILDCIDYLLRKIRGNANPFGGVQVLFIGDMYQLAPIAKGKERDIIDVEYKSPFLIDSRVFAAINVIYIELQKVYRQADPDFLQLLESIRTSSCSTTQIDRINQLYVGNAPTPSNWITLTTHTKQAESINVESLSRLPGDVVPINAKITGEFDENLHPVPKELLIKVGAQVMLVRNDRGLDRKYFNGKIGCIISIEIDKLIIQFPGEDPIEIIREIWVNTKYKVDASTERIGTEVAGTFEQFPIKLAWAITIHKSQGLTFEHAVIDAGGAFTPGQVYVAFSRVKSLNNIQLRSKITNSSITTDPVTVRFENLRSKQADLRGLLQTGENHYFKNILLNVFDWQKLEGLLNITPALKADIFSENRLKLENDLRHARNFQKVIRQLIDDGSKPDVITINQRVNSANIYLNERLNVVLVSFKVYVKANKNDINHRRNMPLAQKIVKEINRILESLEFANKLTLMLSENTSLPAALRAINSSQSRKPHHPEGHLKASDESTESTSLSLLREGNTIFEIASIRNLNVQTIQYQLATFIKSGEVDISELIEQSDLNAILPVAKSLSDKSLLNLKKEFGSSLGFGQIAALREYLLVC